jgi:peptide deformylase
MSTEEKDPNTFEVSVHEEVGLKELTPGGDPDAPKEMTKEQVIEMVLKRRMELTDKYVEPHNKKSRQVTNEDVPRVMEDAKLMHEMCMIGRADYTTAYAIAHPQINDTDPLRFFVTADGQIVINPVITNYTQQFLDKKEGCMSFPEEPMKEVFRFNKITVKYQTLVYKSKDGLPVEDPRLSPVVESHFSSNESQIWQHECQHLNGSNIYDENANALDAIGPEDFVHVDKLSTDNTIE